MSRNVIAIFRVSLALLSLWSVSLCGPYLLDFFSSDGYMNAPQALTLQGAGGGGNSLSVFFLNDTPPFVLFSYLLLVSSLVLLAAGIRPGLSAFVAWFFYLSFYNRFPLIGYGGSEILIMMLFLCSIIYLLLWSAPSYAPLGVQLVQINTAIIYFFAGITKITHPTWLGGFELAAVNNSNYGLFHFGWMGSAPSIVSFGTYAAIVTELAYPFLVWFPQTRLTILALTLGLNLGIASSIQVTFFPHAMLVGSLLFLKEEDVATLKNIWFNALNAMTFKRTSLLQATFAVLLVVGLGWVSSGPISRAWYRAHHEGCDVGFIPVSANPSIGVQAPFCIMKFEAKRSPEGTAVSVPWYAPWTMITFDEAKEACEAAGYRLTRDEEWRAVATAIVSTSINDISPEPGLQLPNGNSNGIGRILGARALDEPVIGGCDLTKPLYTYENRYRGFLCELRGEEVNMFTVKGYFGVGQGWNSFSGVFTPGNPDRSRLRTLVAKEHVIWDLAGNAWEWVDAPPLNEPVTGTASGLGSDSAGFTGDLPVPRSNQTITTFHEFSDIIDWKDVSHLNIPANLNSKNGVGMIYLDPGESWGATPEDVSLKAKKMLVRGGAWGNPTEAGVFALNISHAPTNATPYIGFRCTYNPK